MRFDNGSYCNIKKEDKVMVSAALAMKSQQSVG